MRRAAFDRGRDDLAVSSGGVARERLLDQSQLKVDPERAAGLEPATSCLEGRCYYQLSYARVRASPIGPFAMTVRTNDIALSGLSEDSCVAGAANHLRDQIDLGCRITMIELHRVIPEPPTAVFAGNVRCSIFA